MNISTNSRNVSLLLTTHYKTVPIGSKRNRNSFSMMIPVDDEEVALVVEPSTPLTSHTLQHTFYVFVYS